MYFQCCSHVRFISDNEKTKIFQMINDFMNNSGIIVFSDWSLKLYQLFATTYKIPSIIKYCNYDVHGYINCKFSSSLLSKYNNPILEYINNKYNLGEFSVFTEGQTYRPCIDFDDNNVKNTHKILAVTKIGNVDDWVIVDKSTGYWDLHRNMSNSGELCDESQYIMGSPVIISFEHNNNNYLKHEPIIWFMFHLSNILK